MASERYVHAGAKVKAAEIIVSLAGSAIFGFINNGRLERSQVGEEVLALLGMNRRAGQQDQDCEPWQDGFRGGPRRRRRHTKASQRPECCFDLRKHRPWPLATTDFDFAVMVAQKSTGVSRVTPSNGPRGVDRNYTSGATFRFPGEACDTPPKTRTSASIHLR